MGVKRHLFLPPTLLSYLDKRTNRKFSLPLNVSEPGGVPESFGKRIAVYFQLGYLGRKKWGQNDLISEVNETKSEISFSFPIEPSDPVSIRRSLGLGKGQVHRCTGVMIESKDLAAYQARRNMKLDCEGFKMLGKG